MDNERHIGQGVTGIDSEAQRREGLAQSDVIMETPAHTPHLEANTYAMGRILEAINENPTLIDKGLRTGALTERSK